MFNREDGGRDVRALHPHSPPGNRADFCRGAAPYVRFGGNEVPGTMPSASSKLGWFPLTIGALPWSKVNNPGGTRTPSSHRPTSGTGTGRPGRIRLGWEVRDSQPFPSKLPGPPLRPAPARHPLRYHRPDPPSHPVPPSRQAGTRTRADHRRSSDIGTEGRGPTTTVRKKATVACGSPSVSGPSSSSWSSSWC
jgi:hypothetical protein